jgi:hypothetical protein
MKIHQIKPERRYQALSEVAVVRTKSLDCTEDIVDRVFEAALIHDLGSIYSTGLQLLRIARRTPAIVRR